MAKVAAGHRRHKVVYIQYGQTQSHPNCGLTASCDGECDGKSVLGSQFIVRGKGKGNDKGTEGV